MIKRTSRNFKVPLVYGGQWKDHQTFQKWDPISKRLIQVNCCLPGRTVQSPAISYQFISVSAGSAVDPGSGNTSSNIISFPTVILNFNKTDKNANNANSYLSGILPSASITITKDISNYSVFTVNSRTDLGTYWTFNCTITSFVGAVNFGDTITLTY